MSDIRPIDLPTAAGVEFGRGDVRHFSEADALDVPGLQNPTRHLAMRDNLLAGKLNEVVSVVNNKEQFVQVAVPRTIVGPGAQEILSNVTIPAGFEARILSATIASNPASADMTLKVLFATGIGSSTGAELVSTTSVFSSGVAFYNGGEFIITVLNNGIQSLEAIPSLTMTIRPIGSTASLLVGSVIEGKRGFPGGKGDQGLKGDAGAGGAGSPGMVWSGSFNSSNSYAPPQVVAGTVAGLVESFISKRANPSPSVAPPDPTYWDLVVAASSATGKNIRWNGPWSNAVSYLNNATTLDFVSYTIAGVTSTYSVSHLVTSTTAGHDPVNFPGEWDLVAGPGGGETPTWLVSDLSSTTTYTSNVSGTIDGNYGSILSSGNLPCKEYAGTNTIGTFKGLVFLSGGFLVNLPPAANLVVTLPVSAAKVGDQWLNSEVALQASAHGTNQIEIISGGTYSRGIDVYKPSSSQWQLTNLSNNYRHVDVSFFGMKIR